MSFLGMFVALATCMFNGIGDDNLIKISPKEEGVKLVSATKNQLEATENAVIINEKSYNCGFALYNKWDFTGCSKLRFTVINRHEAQPIYLTVSVYDSRMPKYREPVDGAMVHKYTIDPSSTREIEMDFIAPLPHPEVNAKFYLMRNFPFSRVTGHDSYVLNIDDVVKIAFIASRMSSKENHEWEVRDIVAVKGELKELPACMQMDSSEFFPFIDKYGQFKYAEWDGKIKSDKDLRKAAKKEAKDLAKHPGPDDWSKYGGWKKGPKLEATGHFRVEKVDGKWWMVDPEGYLFWSNGMVRVTTSGGVTPLTIGNSKGNTAGENIKDRTFYFEDLPAEGTEFAQFYKTHDELLHPYYTARNIDSTYDFSSANCYRKYGKDYKAIYAELAHKRLRSWGFNTIANSSDKSICLMDKTPYIDRFEVVSKPLAGTTGWWPFMDPFDPSFNESLVNQLIKRKRELEDPWCLGFFVDNEIRWGSVTYLSEMTIMAPADQMAKQAMLDTLKGKYSSIDALNKAWKTTFSSWDALLQNRKEIKTNKYNKADFLEFNRAIIHKYYSNIRTAFDKYAPGVLYMGCRFAGSTPDVVGIGAEYCDVISFNAYRYHLKGYYPVPEGIDKPVIIGEFHFGASDHANFHPSLIDIESQSKRGDAFYNYVKSALENPNVIGVHWHQFSDQATTGRFDGENFNVGFTSVCDTPYYETIEGARKIGYKMYEVRYCAPIK